MTACGTGMVGRKTPCATCPYRQSVPSGVWHPDEYDKLPEYDGEMATQPPQVFMCHQGDQKVCSGWLGYGDPNDLLAVRIGVMTGTLDPSTLDYSTTVPLFASGAEAAEHGKRDAKDPGPEARKAAEKLTKKREL